MNDFNVNIATILKKFDKVQVVQLGLRLEKYIANLSLVFTTELLAILWALWWTEDIRSNKVLTCSDSADALMALKRGKSVAPPDLLNEIFTVLFRIGMTDCEVLLSSWACCS